MKRTLIKVLKDDKPQAWIGNGWWEEEILKRGKKRIPRKNKTGYEKTKQFDWVEQCSKV